MTSWKEATEVRKLGASTYECTLQDAWTIGTGKFQSTCTRPLEGIIPSKMAPSSVDKGQQLVNRLQFPTVAT